MPRSGWLMVKDHGPAPEIATLRFLLPVCLLTGASEFLTLLYPGEHSFTGLLVAAVISFCAFFIGYYVALVLEKLFLPGTVKELPSSPYGKLLTMTGVASLALFHILYRALPMLDFLIEFMPLWTVFITYRGLAIADISHEKYPLSLGVMCVVIVCAPMLTEWILTLFT